MTADEDYGFDVAGFIHVRQVLTSAEVGSAGGGGNTIDDRPAAGSFYLHTGWGGCR